MYGNKIIHIFLSYAFKPRQKAYTKEEIQKVVRKSIDCAKKQLDGKLKDIQLEFDCELIEYGGILKLELLSKINLADIFIVDISDNNPNVFYELGYNDALCKNKIIILKSKKESNNYKVPSDISDRLYLEYDFIHNIIDRLTDALIIHINKIFVEPLRLDEKRQLWFPENTKIIHVIGPKSQTKTEFSEITSSNYTHFHKFGDKDAILELLLFLTKLYPDSDIKMHMSEDFDLHSGLCRDNLVIVGGPGDDEGNKISQEISEYIKSSITYSDNCEIMRVKDHGNFSSSIDDKGKTKQDYGYFGRIHNPFNMNSNIILIHGIHTFGVLGAAQAFSDNEMAKHNIEKVLSTFDSNPYFESWFPVNVIEGKVITPKIKQKMLKKRNIQI